MAAPKVKSLEATVTKWVDRGTAASGVYASEAAAAGTEWENRAVEGAPNFKAEVTKGDIDRRFIQGVRQAGSAKYQRGITSKGADRYSGGISAGVPEMRAGMGPVLQTIAGTDLPARRPRGMPENRKRSEVIQEALHKARLARLGAGR